MTGKFARDEEALEPLVLLVGIAIILIGVVIMWALGVLIWLAVGALFAVGGSISWCRPRRPGVGSA